MWTPDTDPDKLRERFRQWAALNHYQELESPDRIATPTEALRWSDANRARLMAEQPDDNGLGYVKLRPALEILSRLMQR